MRTSPAFSALLVVAFLAAGLVACDSAAPLDTASSNAVEARPTHANVNAALAQARAATAGFHQVETAVAAGYLGEFMDEPAECVEHPVEGGMGYHYINAAEFVHPSGLDVRRPQAILYEPQRNGSLRMVGVEYIVPGAIYGPDEEPPVLFNEELHWNPALGIWALHVWIWRNNPSGMFADWNPLVSCAHAP
jgi:hypothetical protein